LFNSAAVYRFFISNLPSSRHRDKNKDDAERHTEERLLDLLLPGLSAKPDATPKAAPAGSSVMP